MCTTHFSVTGTKYPNTSNARRVACGYRGFSQCTVSCLQGRNNMEEGCGQGQLLNPRQPGRRESKKGGTEGKNTPF